ncbi:LTA synthase family protein [Komagataeibacter swingsii]|uniref:LTA synthase family protein n=1 Tax=Komagataeibacter swingsii TaxID=215220 RepID=A0A850P7G2_9PROT|nr:LTA synthase family protein [Komagataeibacter swingsii]AHI26673.1 sulfatase [Komagataeibacter xylinus E25]NVN38256.1 LTA synthase family protein [Komagataeibacter swingsii]RFO99681.1 capsular biosynthesis protein [Komagataeibacter xylinus]RFP04939.1 capsular biosynthesis protein [Komagataeibacter xylinus]
MQLWFPFLTLIAAILGGFLVEGMTRPFVPGVSSVRRYILDTLLTGAQYGMWLGLCGTPVLAALLTTAITGCLVKGSNIKLAILGEPLLFSDVVAARSFLQHPKFYLFSIPLGSRILIVGGMVLLPVLLVTCSTLSPRPHMVGLACLLICLLALRAIPARQWAPVPDAARDITRLGLPGMLFLYWRRWREEIAMQPAAAPAVATKQQAIEDVVIVVQCESFANPADLFAASSPAPIRLPTLPSLSRAQSMASQWGTLAVSGFGAYTMRTEYGVLFGRNEDTLGFRAYDPFLTADRDTATALPAIMKQAGYDCLFVHPHDLRFYGRDQLMPLCGFDHLIGEESFSHTPRPDMPYTEDMAMAQHIGQLAENASGPTFIYAVTMENHGPWPARPPEGARGALGHYCRHVQNSDRMLGTLLDMMADTGKKGLLVFFGDHRPSIPGLVMPTAERGTPYVVVPFGQQEDLAVQTAPQTLTPAQLHHLILRGTVRKVAT